MASGGYRDVTDPDSDLEIDLISPEEMARVCDVGNEQTWLWCSENSNPNSHVDLSELLQYSSPTEDKERLYRAVVELETSKSSGGIDTRTFTRPKKMSLHHPSPKMSKQECNISFQPSGGVNTRFSFLSKSPSIKGVSSLKDVTNSTFDTSLKKPHSILHRILNSDDFNITDQTMIADMSTPSFLSISDSDDGMSENIPNISITSKCKESRMKRGRFVENRLDPQGLPSHQAAQVSPSVWSKYNYGGSPLDIAGCMNSSSETLNGSITLDCEDKWSQKAVFSTPKSLQHSPAKTSGRKASDDGVSDAFTAFDRAENLASPKSSPKFGGLRRLSYNNTFRLSKSEEPKHFKSVESGLDSTFEIPNHSPGRINKDSNNSVEVTYSSTGNIPRSLGDVHLAAQQQEYQLRDDVMGIPNVVVPTLKSPMKKVLSENCIFSSNDDVKLGVASNRHGSVSNLSSNNNNRDNNNQPTEFPSKITSASSKKNLSSGLPISTRPTASRIPAPKSRIPSRLPTRMPRLQPGTPKGTPDWTEGCY